MESFSTELISVLQFLLPGFVTAWVFYGLTSFPIPSKFERVVQALVFTIIIQFCVLSEKWIVLKIGSYFSYGEWNNYSEIFYSVLTALFIGVIFAYLSNSDKLHKIARDCGITRETSYPSEWFGTFLNNRTFVVLHLKDERRLRGWPSAWPSDPNKGHFVLEEASWIPDIESDKEIPLDGVKSIMINVKDVYWVEFLK
ncbi:DUF6338 family protein [bacterium]|nr:DUF6338 family protein [bacterium]